MRLSKLVLSTKANRIPVEAFAALLIFATLSSEAATGPSTSSWSDQPTWATPSSDSSNAPVRKNVSHQSYNTNSPLAPFSPGSSNVALDVGQVFLMGQMGNKYSDSIGEQVHYTYGVSELFGFDSSLGYSSHSDGNFSMLSALTGLRTNLSYYDKVVPYAIMGLGFYKPSYNYSVNGADQTMSSVLFGLHAGIGVDLEVTRSMFFGTSLTLHDIFGSNQDVPAGQIALGGTYASFMVHAGVTF